MATASDQAGPSSAAAQPEAEPEIDRTVHPSGIVPQLQVRYLNVFTETSFAISLDQHAFLAALVP